jgi:hypothetical protein
MDPACGSGAFLVEALAQLHNEHERVNRSLAELRGASRQRSLLDLDRLILQRNLYGRDLLPESVEISRLSIWLRTARRGERLEALNTTITVGDSLTAGDLEQYDAVIGNPPWGAELEGWTDTQVTERFPHIGGEKDSYAIFVMRAWELLKPGGMLAFILPNSWLTVDAYTPFRIWLRMPGEPGDMHLVDDGLCEGPTERRIALPVIRARIDDDALQDGGGVVSRLSRRLATATRRAGDAFPVGVQQDLVRVKAQPPRRIEGPRNAVAIELARGYIRDKRVSIMVRAIDTRVEIYHP